MAALLHFEEKVHKRRLTRAASIHLLFPRLLCHVLAHMGFPADPRSEPRRHCRESFALEQWNQYGSISIPQNFPSQGKSLLLRPLQLLRSLVPCLARFFQTLTTTQTAIMERMDHFQLQQDQQTLILREIQQHLGLLPPAPPVEKPSSVPAEDPSYPPEEPTT
ncbi:hypothetical protein CK203_048283 [Vitis vinifera]|uniref:Uncharacterized protein n=1 Tax=Vitis vinifera TaxID=29760 RepID=A0A438H075_VITVI|nr:hypothetical protein CK203_048283 [Vitis vinifera]